MTDESNALRNRLLERATGVLELRGMKGVWPAWPQETADLIRQAAAQIESLTREKAEHEADIVRNVTRWAEEKKTLRAELDAAKVDTERLDWIEQWIFDSHWGGSVSTPCTYWGIASNWRYVVKPMYGPSNFREAIDTARSRGETVEKIG